MKQWGRLNSCEELSKGRISPAAQWEPTQDPPVPQHTTGGHLRKKPIPVHLSMVVGTNPAEQVVKQVSEEVPLPSSWQKPVYSKGQVRMVSPRSPRLCLCQTCAKALSWQAAEHWLWANTAMYRLFPRKMRSKQYSWGFKNCCWMLKCNSYIKRMTKNNEAQIR